VKSGFSTISTITFGLIIFLFSSCGQTNNNKAAIKEKIDTLKVASITPTQDKFFSNNDTLIVDKTCAVIVTADSLQIEKRKKELGENFYIGSDDYLFYLNEMQLFLDSVKLKTIDCNGKKFLKFLYADNRQELINLTNLDELWKVYLFDPKRKSKSVDMTIIDQEYKNYFK
jgi:hypothetical protein